MSELVGDHIRDTAQLLLAGLLGIDEERRLPEGDRPQVLHRSESEVGESDEVHLVSRVGNAVVVPEPAQEEGARFQGERGEVPSAGRMDDAKRRAVDVHGCGDLEGSHYYGHQVRGHGDGVVESHRHLAVAGGTPLRLGGVADGSQLRRDHHGHGEHRLQVGLVPAGEGAPGVGGLELSGGDDPLLPRGVLEGAAVEASQPIIQHPAEGGVQGPPSRGDDSVEYQRRPLGLLVVDDRRSHPDTVGREQVGVGDLQLRGVDHHLGHFRAHVKRDLLEAAERCLLQVGLQRHGVSPRDDGARQAVRIGHEDPRTAGCAGDGTKPASYPCKAARRGGRVSDHRTKTPSCYVWRATSRGVDTPDVALLRGV